MLCNFSYCPSIMGYNDTNITMHNNDNADPNPAFSIGTIVVILLYGITTVLGTIGNALVIKSFTIGSQKNLAGSRLITILAANDFLASIFLPLYEVHSLISVNLQPVYAWYLGKALCHTLVGSQIFFLVATSWLLVAIASERYR